MTPILTAAAQPQDHKQRIGSLDRSSQDLDDHFQILAAENLLRRTGLTSLITAEDDNHTSSTASTARHDSPCIILSSNLSFNISSYHPQHTYCPMYLGFHIRRSQVRELTSPIAVRQYIAHGPIGCADRYTLSLLRSCGVDAFLSQYLTICFARRTPNAIRQLEVYVASHSRRILKYLPTSFGPYTFVSHYSDSKDFRQNKVRSSELLATYRDRAKLIVTTSPNCALSAMAMGIPVVVMFPPGEGSHPEIERFSSISEIVRVFRPEEATLINWRGYTPDLTSLKLKLLDSFLAMAKRWGPFAAPPLTPISPSWWPATDYFPEYLADPGRAARLARAKAPDRQKWGTRASYVPERTERAKVIAQFICDGSRVLEIGTGSGTLRSLIAHRCQYTGADLEPLDQQTLVYDLEQDPVPRGPWDTIVLVEVLEYIYRPSDALRKLGAAAPHIVLTYCCRIDEDLTNGDEDPIPRHAIRWTEQNLRAAMAELGFQLSGREFVNSTPAFEQLAFEFSKSERLDSTP